MNKALSATHVSLPSQPDEQDLLAAIVEHADVLQPLCETSPSARALLTHISAGSAFLSGLVRRYPEFAVEALSTPPDQLFSAVCERLRRRLHCAVAGRSGAAHLRVAENHVALLIALADVAGCCVL